MRVVTLLFTLFVLVNWIGAVALFVVGLTDPSLRSIVLGVVGIVVAGLLYIPMIWLLDAHASS